MWGFAMGAAVRLREDYEAAQLRALARRSADAAQTRRLLALARIVESGPIPAAPGVVRWRLVDLAQGVFDQFARSISKQTLSRELRAFGLRKVSARPRHHAQDGEAVAAFQKISSPAWTRSPGTRHLASR
jgi:hypothetical protein